MSKKELLDVVNEQNEVIGVATKKQCHEDPKLLHRTVQFTLIDPENKKIFLTQRSYQKSHDAGLHCFLGEHVLSGESYDQGLVRGVEEELGFTPDRYLEMATKLFSYDFQSELVKFYIVTWYKQDLLWDKKELEEVHWVDLDDLSSKKYNISNMTSFWVKPVDWDFALK